MRVLITGAGGFLGRAVAKHLAKECALTTISGSRDFFPFLNNYRGAPFDRVLHLGFSVDFRQGGKSYAKNLLSARALASFCSVGHAEKLIFVSAAGVMGVGANPRDR